MAGASIRVHPMSDMDYGPLERMIGKPLTDDLLAIIAADENGKKPDMFALTFTDRGDGETHAYVFTDTGKQNLIRRMTGGLVVPSG